MQEILERIYNSLLTDESNSHDRLFREMERAQLKDAIYKLPEQQPASENKEGSNLSNDEVLAGKPKYDPAEGFLKTEPTSPPKAASGGTAEYRTKLLQFSNTANELLEFFIPADYSNDVIRRYYGSIKRILNVMINFALYLQTLTFCRTSTDFKGTTKSQGFTQTKALSGLLRTLVMIWRNIICDLFLNHWTDAPSAKEDSHTRTTLILQIICSMTTSRPIDNLARVMSIYG